MLQRLSMYGMMLLDNPEGRHASHGVLESLHTDQARCMLRQVGSDFAGAHALALLEA